MNLNDPIFDEDGRPAKVITLPIPGRTPALAVALYPDGRGRLVDLSTCKPATPQEEPCPPAKSS